jgi:hypothetical protein
MTLFSRIAALIAAYPDGCTIDSNGALVNPAQGYAVALFALPDANAAVRYLRLNPDSYVGAWTDPASGEFYLDAVTIIEGKDFAEAAGLRSTQKAIYSFFRKESLTL